MMSIDIPKKKWADILCVVSGKNQKNVVDESGTYPIYGSGGIIGYANDYICEAGTTIIGRKGTINNPIFVNERFWNVDTAFGISPGEELLPQYLYYFCRQFNFASLDKSTTIPSLAKRDLLAIEMPVPPILEQKRIVARIEELFSELDNGVETLRKTKQQLAVYRQAVLKQAFEGRFTTHQQLCVELPWASEEETSTLPNIPAEWRYVALSNLGDLGRGKSKHRPRNDVKLFENGNYLGAYESYKSLKNFEDSPGRANEAGYQYAQQCFREKAFSEALRSPQLLAFSPIISWLLLRTL